MRAKLINEGIISPDNSIFRVFMQAIMDANAHKYDDPFYEINERIKDHGIELVDFDNYLDAIDPQEREVFKRANMVPPLGIRLFSFNSDTNTIAVLVDKTFDDKILRAPSHFLNNILRTLEPAIGHETIHREQVSRMKKVQSPVFRSEDDYLKNRQEVMAMAFSFVQENNKRGMSKSKIMQMLTRPSYDPLFSKYKSLDRKTFNLFKKYASQYAQQL